MYNVQCTMWHRDNVLSHETVTLQHTHLVLLVSYVRSIVV